MSRKSLRRFLNLISGIVLLLTACAAAPSTALPSPMPATGALDQSFGTGGIVITDFDHGNDFGNTVALQPDGRIIMAGYGGEFNGFALARYNSDGSLDTSFGADGKVTTDFGSSYKGGVAAVALRPDGRIVVAGQEHNGSDTSCMLLQFNSDGSFDETFGDNGKVTADFGNSDDYCYSLAIQPDGRILISGRSFNGNNFDFVLARFHSDGSLDASFGDGGKVIADFGDDWSGDIVIQPDGKILASAGSTLARFSREGALELTFGQGGGRLVLQPDGGILVLTGGYGVTRYKEDGSLDETFGKDGLATEDFGDNDVGAALSLDLEGRILVAGLLRQTADSMVFALARYNKDGSLDTTLGGDGMIATSIGGIQDMASAIAVQPDGKVIVAGSSFNGSDMDFALLRYDLEAPFATPAAPPPTSADTDAPPDQPPAEIKFKVVGQTGGKFDAVAIDGDTVYLGVGARFVTVDISDPSSPRWLWQSDVLSDLVGAIASQSTMAYVRAGTELLIYDVSDPARPAQVGALSGVSGDLLATEDFIYTFAAGIEPTLIAIDVSDPAHPAKASQLDLTGTAAMAVGGEILYLVNGGGSPNNAAAPGALQLIHRTQVLSQIALEDAWSYQIAVERDLAFVVGNNQIPGTKDALLVFDVKDPANPRQVTRREMSVGGDIKATNGALFLLGRAFPHGGCPAGLKIVDVTDPASPRDALNFDPPQSCFNRFTVEGDTLAATSERGLEIYNVSDPANIALIGELAPSDGFIAAGRVAANQVIAYLVTTDGRNRMQRLHVLDVTSPSPILLSGEGLDLGAPDPSIFEGLYVRGVRLFGMGSTSIDISDPLRPHMAVGDIGVDNEEGVFYWPPPVLVGNVLYTGLLTNTPDGLRIGGGIGIVDVSDPNKPALVGRIPMEGFTVSAMAVTGKHLIAFGEPRLRVYDVSDPFNPIEMGGLDFPSPFGEPKMVVLGNTVYLAPLYKRTDHTTLYAVDISNPAHPVQAGAFELTDIEIVIKMIGAGDTIYMMAYDKGILALNVSDRTQPYLSGRFPFPVNDFTLDGDLLYLAAGDAGLVIVQVEK